MAEGTRFTTEKHEASKKFAEEKGLPVLKHHLTPRTKGFTTSLPYLHGKFGGIYNVQLSFQEYVDKRTSFLLSLISL
jgi:lysophosphatidic acid acyltransferase/lysophosphatidylinositol acyltransferase